MVVVRGEWCELQDAENGQKYVHNDDLGRDASHMSHCRIGFGKPTGVESASKITIGSQFTVGGKECEVDCPLEPAEYLSGRCFSSGLSVGAEPSHATTTIRNSSTASKQYVPLKPRTNLGGFKPPTFVSNGPKDPTTPNRRQSVTVTSQQDQDEYIAPVMKGSAEAQEACWTANW